MSQAEAEERGAEYHFEKFMESLGLGPDDSEHLAETPERVARAYEEELFRGLKEDPREYLDTTFSDVEQHKGDAGWLIEDNIQVQSMCAHHFLPFRGVAHVGYIPKDEVVGLSKFARLVDGYARRPQVQERLTNQVADAIQEELDPRATMVVIEAEHECMTVRGVKEPHSQTRTAAIRGQARGDGDLKQEFYHLLGARDGRS